MPSSMSGPDPISTTKRWPGQRLDSCDAASAFTRCGGRALRKAQRASRSFASRTVSPGSLQLSCVQEVRSGEGEDQAMCNRCLLLADAHPNMLAAVRDLLAAKFA